MAKEEIHKQKRQQWTLATTSKFYPTLYKRSRYLAEVKGVSSWLTSLLIGFSLQGDLALALQYDWQPTCTLSNCVCHTKFSIEDALSCFVLSLYCYVFLLLLLFVCFSGQHEKFSSIIWQGRLQEKWSSHNVSSFDNNQVNLCPGMRLVCYRK